MEKGPSKSGKSHPEPENGLSKWSKILGLMAVTALAVPYAGEGISEYVLRSNVADSVAKINGVTDEIQRDVMKCIGNEPRFDKQDESGRRSFSVISWPYNSEYKAHWRKPVMEEIDLESGSSSGGTFSNSHICQTAYGLVQYSHGAQVNGKTCAVEENGDLAIVVPVGQVLGDQDIVVKKGKGVERDLNYMSDSQNFPNSVSPELYLVINGSGEINSGNQASDNSVRISTAVKVIAKDEDGMEKNVYLGIPISKTVGEEAGKTRGKWKSFVDAVVGKIYDRTKKDRIDKEMGNYNGDMSRLIKDYVDRLPLFNDGATPADIKTFEREKKKLADRIGKFYKFLAATAGPERKKDIIEMLYRFFKCSPVNSFIKPDMGDAAGTADVEDNRKLSLNASIHISDYADVWFHEIIHKITLEDSGKCPRDDTFKVFSEGLAELSEYIVNSKTMKHGPQYKNSISYADFALLTAGFMGQDGYVKSMLDKNGFNDVISAADKRIDIFMKKWKIDKKFKHDLGRVFGNGSAFSDLKVIKVDPRNDWWHSTNRLFVLRRILDKSGVNWDKFVAETSKEFGIPPIVNGFNYGDKYEVY